MTNIRYGLIQRSLDRVASLFDGMKLETWPRPRTQWTEGCDGWNTLKAGDNMEKKLSEKKRGTGEEREGRHNTELACSHFLLSALQCKSTTIMVTHSFHHCCKKKRCVTSLDAKLFYIASIWRMKSLYFVFLKLPHCGCCDLHYIVSFACGRCVFITGGSF